MSVERNEIELAKAIREVIADDFEPQLADGRAAVTETSMNGELPAAISIAPRNELAAPLVIQIDHAQQITRYPGRNGMLVEDFSKDPADLVEGVQELTKAVAQGRYEETVRRRGGRDQGTAY